MLLTPNWQRPAGLLHWQAEGTMEMKSWSGKILLIIVTLTIKTQNEDNGVLYFLMGCFEGPRVPTAAVLSASGPRSSP